MTVEAENQQGKQGRAARRPLGADGKDAGPNDVVRLVGIFGTGRSGSTWLGSILNSHPEVAYRFEPFRRLKNEPRMEAALRAIRSETDGELIEEHLRTALLPADCRVEKPIFFPKGHSPLLGKNLLWHLGLHRSFARLYHPRGPVVLAFKEVNKEGMMMNLLGKTSVPLVYLVRHPCAVVSSHLRGQQRGLTSRDRLDVIESLLRERAPELLDEYEGRLRDLSDVEKNALIWRIHVDQGIRAIDGNPKALLVIYENLCENTREVVARVFEHFDLEITAQTEQYLEKSTRPQGIRRRLLGEWFTNAHFSTFRDPRHAMESWRKELSPTEQGDVLRIVGDGEGFQHCQRLGYWA